MILANENYSKIQASYLFTEIAHRVKAFQQANPAAKVRKNRPGATTPDPADTGMNGIRP